MIILDINIWIFRIWYGPINSMAQVHTSARMNAAAYATCNVRFVSAMASSFALVAWEGKNPTWSVVDSALIDGTPEP